MEGMDCHEEVVILERRLGGLVGLESLSADLIGQRLTAHEAREYGLVNEVLPPAALPEPKGRQF